VANLDLDLPIYVETRGLSEDNDGIAVMMRDSGGGFVAGGLTSDYMGVTNSSGTDGIAQFNSLPSSHRQGFWLDNVGDIFPSTSYHRIGLLYDGSSFTLYIDGVEMGSASATIDLSGVGFASFANSGNPGSRWRYMWVGSKPIQFNPGQLTSAGTGLMGQEQPF